MSKKSFIRWFSEVSIKDIGLVGGKNASLGEMIKNLANVNVAVPNGFALTTNAYQHFLAQSGIKDQVFAALKSLDIKNVSKLSDASVKIQKIILQQGLPDAILAELKSAYYELRGDSKEFYVAVRSSASAEDLPDASFAGQQDTFLYVKDFSSLLEKVVLVYASMFSQRAISYREHNKFSHEEVLMSVGVQQMVQCDEGASGVMFTIDPETGFKKAIFINGSYGIGEAVVQGSVNPDEFTLHKPSLKNNKLVVLNKRLGSKEKKLVFDESNHKENLKEVLVSLKEQQAFCLNNDDLLELGKSALLIEEHYKKPMDIEWAKESKTNKIFILQARPETIHGQAKKASTTIYLKEKGKELCQGRAVGKSIGQGLSRVLKNISEASDFEEGQVLVTDMTDPNWEPIMQKASAIVTNRGGRTCHAAIIARELGIAAIVGTSDGTKKIPDKTLITVSCAEGDTGVVYEGLLKTEQKSLDAKFEPIDTDLMLIAANPQKSFSYHHLPHKGIGLARLEFIIANSIGIHPCAILEPSKIPQEIHKEILRKSETYTSPEEFYVNTLVEGIASLASVAAPNKCIVRLSDFKTNEYEELLGGSFFEHKENNPMLGFRGVARYLSPAFQEAFFMECMALKKVVGDYGFSNVEVMVPFCRNLSEAEKIIRLLEKQGISKAKGYKIIMMCEVPSNVILAQEFLQYFDGFSIGSNDLTQLTLGVDRDSHLVANAFCESDEAVLRMLSLAISACKKQGKYVGICGQGPSDDLNFAKWLIKEGIDSISLTPDTIVETHLALQKDLA